MKHKQKTKQKKNQIEIHGFRRQTSNFLFYIHFKYDLDSFSEKTLIIEEYYSKSGEKKLRKYEKGKFLGKVRVSVFFEKNKNNNLGRKFIFLKGRICQML